MSMTFGLPCRLGSAFVLLAAILILLLFTIYGCATPAPVVQTRTVTTNVDIPVAVACVARGDLPPLPTATPIDVAKARTDQKAAATAADAEMFERYAKAAAALLEHCVQTGGTKP